MPFKYKFVHPQATVIVKADGKIDLQSSTQAMRDVVGDKEFQPHYKAVIDLRKMKYNPSILELFAIRDSVVSLAPNFKSEIILITNKEFQFAANVVCTLAKVYNINMTAVCELEGLDDLEADLSL